MVKAHVADVSVEESSVHAGEAANTPLLIHPDKMQTFCWRRGW
jgi:hypothetical protein